MVVHKGRINKEGFRAKYPWEKPQIPDIPYTIFKDSIWAKCPGCGRITTLRTCYGCKVIFCYECLSEHQITCLRKEADNG